MMSGDDSTASDHRLPRPGEAVFPASAGDRMPAYAILDNIRSVWNVGSIFRTADAVALGGLYLCGMTATPPRPDIEKTALGATRSVPWDYWSDSVAAARHLKDLGLPLIALEQTARSVGWESFRFPFPHCFIVGHEVNGVNKDLLDLVDQVVEIPMAGVKHSLNVAVSFGVLAFEIRRRYLQDLRTSRVDG
ncbi:MAG: RNA methyltransferase [Candidatus Krumholzibacteriota bacterium]